MIHDWPKRRPEILSRGDGGPPSSGDLLVARALPLLALAAAVVAVGAKWALLPFPVSTAGEFLRWCLRLGVVSSADLAFVAGLSLATWLGDRGGQRLGLSARWRLPVWAGLFLVSGLYSVASVAIWRMMMVPLTLPLLSFSGGPWLMASSLAALVTPGLCLGLVAVPLFVGLALAAATRGPLTNQRTVANAKLLLTVIGGGTVASQVYIDRAWTDPHRWERRISASPQWVFLESVVDGLLRGDAYGLSFDPAEVDLSDFTEPPPDERAATIATVAPAGRLNPDGAVRLAATAAREPAQRVSYASPARPAAPRRPKNLVVVVLESVGAEYLSLYGSPHATTPELERWAAQGSLVAQTCYSQAPSSPKCLVALTSAVYPRVDWKIITRDSPDFAVPTLPAVLSEEGYRTAYLHSGYWSWKNRDRFLRRRGVQTLIDGGSLAGAEVFSWGVADAALFRAGLEWIDEAPRRPFHLLFWTIETHHPYLVTGATIDFGVDDPEFNRYLNAVRQSDRLLGWLAKELARRELLDDTLVVVTGDHGEAFGQHGQRAHSFGVYEENVRVPLVLLHPSLGPGKRELTGACQQIDLAPTSLALLGHPAPGAWQGRDLLGPGPAPRAYFYALGNQVLLGLRDGRFKYHFHVGSGHERLFDLAADPHELRSVAAEHPERTAEYRRRVGGLVRHQREFLSRHGSR